MYVVYVPIVFIESLDCIVLLFFFPLRSKQAANVRVNKLGHMSGINEKKYDEHFLMVFFWLHMLLRLDFRHRN